jgi:hypothetical protein
MKLTLEEIESAALKLAADGMEAMDACLVINKCFPIFEEERRTVLRNSFYVVARAAMRSVALAVKAGDDVAAAEESKFQLPPPTNPPSPV